MAYYPSNMDDEDPRRRIIHLGSTRDVVTVEVAGFEVPLDSATAARVTKATQDGDWDLVGKILAGVASDGSIPDHATLREKARISAQIASLQRKYAELEAIPPEPRPENSPNGVAVLQFNKTFGVARSPYTYAAVKASGLWTVTGKQCAGKNFTWPELWKFINQGENSTPTVWFANGFAEL